MTERGQEVFDAFYQWHLRGAVVRVLASLAMWLVCLGAYGAGLVQRANLLADTLAVAFLILMNPPLLWILKRVGDPRRAEAVGLVINGLEIAGYTAVIYALGGSEATYLLIIYAALVVYVGMRGAGYRPFLVAGMCSLAFGLLLTGEHLGLLPSLRINPTYAITWPQQQGIWASTTMLLMVVASISAYTARLLHQSRHRLQRQNASLEAALGKAQAAERLKTEFLANVSHELRTPLNAILGFSELLREGAFGPLNEGQRDSLRDIHGSGTHLLALIDDLLDLSKVEADRMTLIRAAVDLPRLLAEAVHPFREKAREKGVRLAIDLAAAPAALWGDERRLRQVLYNLLSNALKFTPAGGEVRLDARPLAWESGAWWDAAGAAVALPLPAPGEGATARFVEIRVADTGIGILPGDRERIFNPFEQADGALNRRYEGTGLGLALTRRFTEMHGGRVWVESEGEGRGSLFRVLLPL